jgi:DNA mismatch repair protein MutL
MVDPAKIKKLPDQLINQIAAGEVIERPASAVKELLDNSIDAGAKNIQVQVLTSDARSFRVTDDGIGINPAEIELAFSKHATSKIAELDDLNHISTKGFRGEALASIASIAQVTLLTKFVKADAAVKASFDKNGQLVQAPAAFAKGTSFEVRDLFANVPVRLKFMKRPETEIGALQDMVREVAIAHPAVSIELKIKDKTIFKTSGSGVWDLTVREALQEKIDFKYLEVIREEPAITLKGLIAPLSEARSDRRAVITMVNQRPIQCEIMRKAIRSVYSGFLPAGKFPRLILSLTLPPEAVDVNVHPTKREVRYMNPQLVYQLVQNALEKHLILNSSLQTLPKDLVANAPSKAIEFSAKPELASKNDLKQKVQSTEQSQSSTNQTLKLELNPQIPSQSFAKSPEADTHVMRISELQLKKVSGPERKKTYRAERSNSTDFCLASGDMYLSGQVQGPKWVRDSYLQFLSEWLLNIDLSWNSHDPQAKQILAFPKIASRRAKVSPQILNEIWERDGWVCVYCGKKLLHPQLVKKALKDDPEGWITKISSTGQPYKTHLLREHQATYDHYLPVSHNPSFSLQKDNLLACCRSCNQAKSNSTNQQKWQPQKNEPWSQPAGKSVQLGNLVFQGPQADAQYSRYAAEQISV